MRPYQFAYHSSINSVLVRMKTHFEAELWELAVIRHQLATQLKSRKRSHRSHLELIRNLPTIENPRRKAYKSDLSDAEWVILKPLLPTPKGFGHPIEVDLREILNAIFYVQRTGCQWEMLSHDLPPYTTVYGYFQKWQPHCVFGSFFTTLCVINYDRM